MGADSPSKSRLRLPLARTWLPEFEPDAKLLDPVGNPLISPVLACGQYRTWVESDGKHHFTPEQQGRDHNRDLITSLLGWHQARIDKAGQSPRRRLGPRKGVA